MTPEQIASIPQDTFRPPQFPVGCRKHAKVDCLCDVIIPGEPVPCVATPMFSEIALDVIDADTVSAENLVDYFGVISGCYEQSKVFEAQDQAILEEQQRSAHGKPRTLGAWGRLPDDLRRKLRDAYRHGIPWSAASSMLPKTMDRMERLAVGRSYQAKLHSGWNQQTLVG